MNRNCQKCIHHISGNCDVWDCEMQTLEDYRNKAIDEFAERLKSDEFQKYNLDMVFETSRDLSYSQCIDAFHEYINEIAEQMKAELEEEKSKGYYDSNSVIGEKNCWNKAIEIVNELAEEYKGGWIPCSSGEMPKCGEFDVKKVWVTMHRKEVDFYFTQRLKWNNYYKRWEWLNGKKLAEEWEVVAWMYVEVPKPYKEEGGENEQSNISD